MRVMSLHSGWQWPIALAPVWLAPTYVWLAWSEWQLLGSGYMYEATANYPTFMLMLSAAPIIATLNFFIFSISGTLGRFVYFWEQSLFGLIGFALTWFSVFSSGLYSA
jgi:hypothetical protein